MAAFETTPVAFPRADPPSIVQRFLATSERFLFHPPTATSMLVSEAFRCVGIHHDQGRYCLPAPCCSQPGGHGRAVA